jgi:hypothetical protein
MQLAESHTTSAALLLLVLVLLLLLLVYLQLRCGVLTSLPATATEATAHASSHIDLNLQPARPSSTDACVNKAPPLDMLNMQAVDSTGTPLCGNQPGCCDPPGQLLAVHNMP